MTSALLATPAHAGGGHSNYFLTETFAGDNEVQFFDFTLDDNSIVDLITYSYGGTSTEADWE